MSSAPEVLTRLPEARTETVSDLVLKAQQGRIRIPDFQRPLNWEARHVVDLFDSVYRGLPVGSLLLWRKRALAARVRLGPLEITAPEFAEGWWVIDGQQRITTLAASLLRPLPLPSTPSPDDPFVVFFDSTTSRFETPNRSGEVPVAWVPLPVLLDAARLSEWVHEWPLGTDRERRQRVFETGKRIREYQLPLYLVETDNLELLQEIFFRVNKSGKPLRWSEVHDALYGHVTGPPSTIIQLAKDVSTLGMGTLSGGALTTCLLALRGLDVTRPLSEHRLKDPDALRGAVADALPVLRQALAFLKTRAVLPHLRLLPRMMILEVLARFFAIHPEPSSRTKTLLVRWVWRSILGDSRVDERTLERRTIAAVVDDEEASVRQMLALAPGSPPKRELTDVFDARTAGSRLALLALASLAPRDLHDERPIDVSALIERHQTRAFGFIVRRGGAVHAPENRAIHFHHGLLRPLLLTHIRDRSLDTPVLRSHAVDPDCAAALLSQDAERFLALRRARILHTLESLGERLAEWGRDQDRPSIEYLLTRAERGD